MDSPPKAKTRPSPTASCSGGGKFFQCFKPAVLDDNEGGNGCKRGVDETFFACVAEEENEGRALRKVPSGDKGDDGSDEEDRGKKKKKRGEEEGLKLLARASKAVLFETSLATKSRKKKSAKNSLKSISNLSMEADRILKSMDQNSGSRVSDNDKARTTESGVTSSSHSSAAGTVLPSLRSLRSSSTNSSLRRRRQSSTRSSPFNSKQIQSSAVEDGKERPPPPSENSIICLLLLTLSVLVLWGKVCAIVCTSIWLLVVSRWSIIKCAKSPLDVDDDRSNVDSAEYKKKIIPLASGLLYFFRSLYFLAKPAIPFLNFLSI
ncbi:hypothetical protein ACJRO7_023098 [Eucalyptus globulus]|uniref:Uncharacterized protein n=1 Tax=Eucalyptus globulus TaxID=34317 RepID=A0ABD3K6H9_EUCGL